MLDINLLRNHLPYVSEALATRGFVMDVEYISKLEELRKVSQIETELLQSEINKISKHIGLFKKSKSEDVEYLKCISTYYNEILKESKECLIKTQDELQSIYDTFPNIPFDAKRYELGLPPYNDRKIDLSPEMKEKGDTILELHKRIREIKDGLKEVIKE